jgi:undecaprenyl-diphosphatase
MLVNADLKILLEFNSLIPGSRVGAKLFWFLSNNSLFRSLPIFLSLGALWFRGDDRIRRARMAVGLIAVCLALGISIIVQGHFETRLHPSLDPALHLKGMGQGILPLEYGRPWSFPSDTATLFFALSTVVLLANRKAGAVCMAWCVITVGFMRIALGWHYPSDVAVGIALGSGSVFLLTWIKPLIVWVERLFERSEARMYMAHTVFLLFLAEAYSEFPGIQGILQGMKMIASRIPK